MSNWEYVSGALFTSGRGIRVYRSADGLIGMVRRGGGRVPGKGTRYFIWALGDDAPEYKTEDEARRDQAALEGKKP